MRSMVYSDARPIFNLTTSSDALASALSFCPRRHHHHLLLVLLFSWCCLGLGRRCVWIGHCVCDLNCCASSRPASSFLREQQLLASLNSDHLVLASSRAHHLVANIRYHSTSARPQVLSHIQARATRPLAAQAQHWAACCFLFLSGLDRLLASVGHRSRGRRHDWTRRHRAHPMISPAFAHCSGR